MSEKLTLEEFESIPFGKVIGLLASLATIEKKTAEFYGLIKHFTMFLEELQKHK